MLYRHLLPPVDEIVIFGGFKTLVMGRLTELQLRGQGPFFFCNEYFEKMQELRNGTRSRSRVRGGGSDKAEADDPAVDDGGPPPPATMIESAVDLTLRHSTAGSRWPPRPVPG